jgi:Flp pilus assembly protein TadD
MQFRIRSGTADRPGAARRAAPGLIITALLFAAGCSASGGADSTGVAPQAPTFAADVRPIIERRCASCHQPGRAAPFDLLTYDDVRRRLDRIVEVTGRRIMPPWLPDGQMGEFAGDRRMTEDEIRTIRRWAETGGPEGLPSPSIPVAADGAWSLGEPDLVVTMRRPYNLEPQEGNVFRNFVFPVDGFAGGYVRAIEFHPGAARSIHHAVISIDRTRASRRKDASDGEPGYGGMFTEGAQSPDGHFLGWTPGRGPVISPAGLPWRFERGSDLVVQLHLLPGATREVVAPTVGLYFTNTPPTRTPVMMRLGSKAIAIPPAATDYATDDAYVLPVDVELLSIYPHAHYLGREMTADAILPGGQRVSLLHIPRWDFHWQQDYRYMTPRLLPRGTVIRMRYTWDNSGSGPHAAHEPHHRALVLYGPDSTDEMGDLWLQVLPRSSGDADVLKRAMGQREVLSNIAAGEMLTTRAPDVAANHVFLGNAYLDAARNDDARAVLQQAVRLDSRSADAHNALGRALFLTERPSEAIPHFEAATSLDSGDERMFFNLASALLSVNRRRDGAAALRRAVAINPDFAEAHNNLGVTSLSSGQPHEAAAHFRAAVRGNPDYADAHSNLGAALASLGHFADAAVHLRRAVELAPTHAQAQANLRAVLAELGAVGR